MVELVSQRIWDFVSGVAFLPVSTMSATKGWQYAAGRVASVKYVYQCLVNTRTEASDISPVDLWVTEGGFTPFPRWTKSRNKLKGPLSWCSWNQHLYCTVCLNQSNGCNYSLYPIRPSRVPLHLGLCKNLRLPTFLKVFQGFFSRTNSVFAKNMTHPPWSIDQRCNHRTARWTGEVPPATWPQAVARRDSKPWLSPGPATHVDKTEGSRGSDFCWKSLWQQYDKFRVWCWKGVWDETSLLELSINSWASPCFYGVIFPYDFLGFLQGPDFGEANVPWPRPRCRGSTRKCPVSGLGTGKGGDPWWSMQCEFHRQNMTKMMINLSNWRVP